MDWPPSPLWKWPRNFFWGGVFSYFVYKNDLKADKSWLKKFGILVTFWFDNCPTHGWSGSIGMPTCPVLNNCIFPLTDVQLGEGCWSVQVHLHVSWLVIGQHMYCMLTIGQLSWQWCVQWAADLWNADKAPPQNWPCHRPSTLPPSYMDRYILQLDRYILQFIQIHLVISSIVLHFAQT